MKTQKKDKAIIASLIALIAAISNPSVENTALP